MNLEKSVSGELFYDKQMVLLWELYHEADLKIKIVPEKEVGM